MKQRILCLSFLLICLMPAFSQDSFLTADKFFSQVSEKYAGFKDYEAQLTVTAGKNVMIGRVSYKTPELLRIDFSQPAEQVVVYSGNMLTMYLPARRALLTQQVDPSGSSGGASLATAQGLSLMKRAYIVAYETGPDPVPYTEGSKDRVVRLSLTKRGSSEGFSSLKLAVSSDSLVIRSIEGTTVNGDLMKFEFSNFAVNQNIPDARFLYDSPPSANAYNNFLFND